MRLALPLYVALALLLASCSGDDAPPSQAAAPAAEPAPVAAETSSPPADTTTPGVTEPAPPSPAPAPVADAATTAPPPPAVAPAPATTGTAPAYEVSCPDGAKAAEQCQVDKDTYIGWRTFAGQCQVCHGGSGLGSTFAPNLLERFHQRVDYPRFVEVVKNGYTGQVGAMPAWKGNPNVEPHIDRLYRYLKARADGALPPGRPARKP